MNTMKHSHHEEDRAEVVILGASYAGLATALRLATRRTPARVTVIDANAIFVERIRLHQTAAGQKIPVRPLAGLLPSGTGFRQGRVVRIDPARRQVALETPDGPASISYDYLVYALGSAIDTDRVPGANRHALALGSLEQVHRLHREATALAARRGRLLIVGGGATGIELATELAESLPGLRISLLTDGRVDAHLSAAGGRHVRAVMNRLEIDLIEQRRVQAVEAEAAVLEGGETVRFDLCVWAAGFKVSPLAREAGLPVDAGGRLLTGPTLQVPGHPELYGAGDAANVVGYSGAPLRMSCATAVPIGTHVAEQLDRQLRDRALQPFQFAYFVRCMSLGRRDGLIQLVHGDDAPRERILTGRPAAWFKELVCRATVLGPAMERWLHVPIVTWPKPDARALQTVTVRGTLPEAETGRRS